MNTYELDKRACMDNTQVDKLYFSLTKDGVLLKVNQQFCRILHSDRDMLVGTSMLNIIHEDDRALFIQRIAESFDRNLIPFAFRFADIDNSNKSFYVNSCNWISLDEVNIQAISIVGTSEYPTVEQLLFEDITNNLEVGICQYDVQQKQFLYVSPAIESLVGIPVDDLLRDPRLFIANCHAEDIADLAKLYNEMIKVRTDIEYRMLDKDDENRWVRSTITPILDENGNALRYISMIKDITNQKMQNELLQKLDKLNVVGQLAASIAHQIRNPLTTIKGFIQLLEMQNDQPFTSIMTKELETIELMIEEFLQLAKPSSTAKFSITSIQEKINQIVSLMRKEAMLHNVSLQFFLDDEDAFIRCESKQIQQVLMNIIKNSIDAMPDGGVIEIRTAMEGDNMVKITIADSGSGMPLERLQKLGEPYYSQKEKGTGLGLMVSYKIIEFHNGTIQFSSEEGVGTTVDIRLPIIKPS